MKKEDRHADIMDLVQGSSIKQLFDWLHRLAQFRYATKDHLNLLNSKLGTPKKLDELVKRGYLTVNAEVYKINDTAKDKLKSEGYNTDIYQRTLKGKSFKHELKITDYLVKIAKEPDFYAVFYPKFNEPPDYTKEFLNPDCCVVRQNDKGYKIEFIEIEEEKPDWIKHLEGKCKKYTLLAEYFSTYDKWWRNSAKRLKLPLCTPEAFCFSVVCVSKKKLNLSYRGWRFEII